MNELEWSAWLGQMQNEIGVLSTNNMLMEIRVKNLTATLEQQSELIEALKERCQTAEKANQELKEQIQPHRKK